MVMRSCGGVSSTPVSVWRRPLYDDTKDWATCEQIRCRKRWMTFVFGKPTLAYLFFLVRSGEIGMVVVGSTPGHPVSDDGADFHVVDFGQCDWKRPSMPDLLSFFDLPSSLRALK